MADYEFRYAPLTGRLTGNQMIEQTEQAINHLASQVDSAAGQVETISTLANEANENAATALETAEEALATTGRTYITVSTQTDANNYYDSQLIYIADSTSTNIPVADTGMLEVKTNDNKTACEQVFIADSSGDAYYRNGEITAETVGDVTTYTVTWGGWSSQPASQAYVQGELANYLPLSGGTVTGGLTVEGTITGNLAGNADTATNAANATNDANGSPIAGTYLPLVGGTITGNLEVAGALTKGGNSVVTSNFSTFTVSKTNNMSSIAVGQAIRMGNLAIVSFDGQMSTSSKAAWTDTDIMTFSVTTSGTTYGVGLTNNGTSVLLQVANNKVTYRTLSHAVNDDTIRGLLVFPIT